MSAESVRRREVLSDSEATIRQVQGVLSDLGARPATVEERANSILQGLEQRPVELKDLVRILTVTYSEIMGVIESLRQSRGLLEQAAMERLKSTHEKLAEVSSATEMAATGMLDGLDRALALVDTMELTGDGGDGQAPLRDNLRDELHTLMNLLQFQDITAQQLGYAGGVLLDMEDRMMRLARIFDFRGLEMDHGPEEDLAERGPCRVAETHATCDPEASHFEAVTRQAVADEIFR